MELYFDAKAQTGHAGVNTFIGETSMKKAMLVLAGVGVFWMAGCTPNADFSANPESGVTPLSIQFSDQSFATGVLNLNATAVAPMTAWAWDFGDGETSTERNPEHVYYAEGAYSVSLSASNAAGTSVLTKEDFITAESGVSFSANVTAGDAPLTVRFTDTSTTAIIDGDLITERHWDFGDGGESLEKDPSYTFQTPGAYQVVLTTRTASGAYSGTATQTITAHNAAVFEAAFEANAVSGTVPFTVQFTDLTDLAGLDFAENSWEWRFGDGLSSTERDPSHTFETPGTFSVSLTVYVGELSSTKTEADFIEALTETPIPAFTASETAGPAPLTVQFTDTSIEPEPNSDPIVSYHWDFGDGRGSTEVNPSHTFTIPNENGYAVTLTITTQSGATYSHVMAPPISVLLGVPTAEFSSDTQIGAAPFALQFHDLSNPGGAPITQWLWDFGDGGQSTRQHPIYDFVTPGTYTVTLSVTTEKGSDTETKKEYVVVQAPPQADFSVSASSGEPPLAITFTNLSEDGTEAITQWLWDFGDGDTHTVAAPIHTYTGAGDYDVSLTVIAGAGSDTFSMESAILVGQLPTPDFIAAPTTGTAPLTVTFTDQSQSGTDPVTNWAWDFGDRENATQKNPTHTFTQPGAYTVQLTVATDIGAPSQAQAIREDFIIVQ
jgi:PKD repeat protein